MKPMIRRAAVVLGLGLCVIAGIAIWTLITGHLDATGGRVLGSTFIAALCVLTGLVGGALLDRAGPRHWLGMGTILMSATELALALVVIWTDAISIDAVNEGLLRALGASSVLLPAFVHASLMLGRLRPSDARLVRWLTATAIALSAVPAVVVASGVALAVGSPGTGGWRLLGVDLVLAILSTLLVPIVRRLARASGESPQPESAEIAPARTPPNRMTMFRRRLLVHRGHAA